MTKLVTSLVKHKEVTASDREAIKKIVEDCIEKTKDMSGFLLGIKASEEHLKDNVEDEGLFSFAVKILDDNTTCTTVEHMVAGPIFMELNQKYLAGTQLLGDAPELIT